MTKIMMTGASGRVGKELREYGVLPLSGDITNPIDIQDNYPNVEIVPDADGSSTIL